MFTELTFDHFDLFGVFDGAMAGGKTFSHKLYRKPVRLSLVTNKYRAEF